MQFFTDELIKLSKLSDVKQKIYEKFYRPIDIYYQQDWQSFSDAIDVWNTIGDY